MIREKNNSLLVQKRSQAWGIDLVVAFIIFFIGLFVFYLYSLNYSSGEDKLESLFYDGNLIANSILSEGSPLDWNSGNVIVFGILTGEKINETKLERLYSLSINNYSFTKSKFNTQYNYYFFLSENMTIQSQNIDGIGNKPVTYDNLIKINRFTIYRNKPITMSIYIWD